MKNKTTATFKSGSFLLILAPGAMVFVSSFCVMALELAAGRLIARALGSSLYTWTAVICVVLAGIAVGNYLGGRIADKFDAKKALPLLLAASSAACVLTVILNNTVIDWLWPWLLDWPIRVLAHTSFIFLLPSLLLGAISPVVAKMALVRGLPKGRTIGDIYAFGAAGSIAGTFAAGFYLISAIGSIAVIWTVGLLLLLTAVLYRPRLWMLHVWSATFLVLMTLSLSNASRADQTGGKLALKERLNPYTIYADETPYCYVYVERIPSSSDRRIFSQDCLKHSEIIMADTDKLIYPYTKIYGAITLGLSQETDKLSVFLIGGGGYVLPRYIDRHRPGSIIEVAEIDPCITEAAIQAFGLPRVSNIKTFQMDARNCVDEILAKSKNNATPVKYDFVYGDAFNDFSVPYQLVTKEFNEKICKILKDDGVYMLNLIDIYDQGAFLSGVCRTLEQTFPHTYVFGDNVPHNARSTFVIIASRQPFNAAGVIKKFISDYEFWQLSDADIRFLRDRTGQVILTDDYAPVENMLAPVVKAGGLLLLADRYEKEAGRLKAENRFDEAMIKYKKVIELKQESVSVYNEIAMILAAQNKLIEAVETLNKAIDCGNRSPVKTNLAGTYLSLGLVYKKMNHIPQASQYLRQAVSDFKLQLAKDPNSVDTMHGLGLALAETGKSAEAVGYIRQAAKENPYDVRNHIILANMLAGQHRFDEAKAAVNNAVDFMNSLGRPDDASKLMALLIYLESSSAAGIQ